MSPLTFDQEQVQKLAEIGTQLHNVRSQKRLSLPDVAAKTMVQERFLEAIEKGQPEELPEALYVRGFIRRYAELLGLNGVELSERFPLGRESLASSNANFSTGSGTALRPWHLYLLYAAIILAAGTALSYVVSRQSAPSKSSAVAPAASTAPKPKATPKPAVAPKPVAAPVVAKLTLKGDSYLEITADGKSAFVGVSKAGESKTITAKQQISLSAGNAGGVLLSVNNQPAKVMGQAGEVKDVVLTPKSR